MRTFCQPDCKWWGYCRNTGCSYCLGLLCPDEDEDNEDDDNDVE